MTPSAIKLPRFRVLTICTCGRCADARYTRPLRYFDALGIWSRMKALGVRAAIVPDNRRLRQLLEEQPERRICLVMKPVFQVMPIGRCNSLPITGDE